MFQENHHWYLSDLLGAGNISPALEGCNTPYCVTIYIEFFCHGLQTKRAMVLSCSLSARVMIVNRETL